MKHRPRRRVQRRSAGASLVVLLALGGTARAAVSPEKKQQAAAASVLAKAQYDAGNPDGAAALYHQAYVLDPETRGYLYSAARMEQKAGKLALAEKHYVQFLKRAADADTFTAKVKTYLLDVREKRQAEMAAKLKAAEAARAAAEAELRASKERQARAPAPAPARSSALAWGLLGGGAALIGGGAALWVMAEDESKGLPDKVRAGSMSAAEANDRNDALTTQKYVWSSVAGVGVAAAGVAAWLLLAPPGGDTAALQVWPDGRGVGLAMRF